MAAVAETIKALLVQQIGDTPDSRLQLNLDVVWDRWTDKASVSPRLQELYAKRDLIDLALGYYRTAVDANVGVRKLLNSQYYGNLMQMRATTQAEVVRVEALARASRATVAAPLTTTTPTVPPFTPGAPAFPLYPVPDSNDPSYRGSPYYEPGQGSGQGSGTVLGNENG